MADEGLSDPRVRPCSECGRSTRASHMPAVEFPGTVVRGNRERCITCYAALRVPATQPRVVEARAELVLASVPGPRDPQQSDCRIGCCKNSFMCARGYRCACHWRSQW